MSSIPYLLEWSRMPLELATSYGLERGTTAIRSTRAVEGRVLAGQRRSSMGIGRQTYRVDGRRCRPRCCRAKMGLCGPLEWQPAGWRIGSEVLKLPVVLRCVAAKVVYGRED